MALDSEYLLYDRKSPNGDHKLRERVAASLPSKPKVYSVNLFELSQVADKGEKLKTLTENYHVNKVA